MKRILINALAALLSLSALSFGAKDKDSKDPKDTKNEKTEEKPKSNLALAAQAAKFVGAAALLLENNELGRLINPKYIAVAKKAGIFAQEITDIDGNIDYEQLTETLAGQTARKKIVIKILTKLGMPETDIAQYVDLDKAVLAVTIDIKTKKVSFDKAELLKAIKSKQFSQKVAQFLKVPTETVQNPLDLAKHILGEPVVTEEDAFKPEVIETASKQIQQYFWQKGAVTGSSYTLTGVLSACGTYIALSNPYTGAAYVGAAYLTGAAASYCLGAKENKKIDARIAKQEKIIESQIAAQRKYYERQMQMHSLRNQAIGMGLHAATNYLVGDEAIAQFLGQSQNSGAGTAAGSPSPAEEAELKALLSSEFADEMGNFFVAIKDNTKAKAALSNEDILTQALIMPFILFNEEAFIKELTKVEKDALLKALIKYVTHFFKPAQMLKFAQQISQFKAQPATILKALPLLKTMSPQQLHALHGILKLTNTPEVPNFASNFVEKLTPAQLETLYNPALLLIAEFNPEVLLGEQAFMQSISADEEAQQAFAALLNIKK